MNAKVSILAQVDQDALPGKDDGRVIVREHQGFMIYVGQNALTNERLVATHVHKSCLWLHALGSRGSHVVLCHGDLVDGFSDEVIQKAAALALKFSRSKGRKVMISRLENVVKPSNGGVGVFHPLKTTELEVA